MLRDSPFFLEGVARYLAAPTRVDAEEIVTRFRSLRDNYHYADLGLLDAAGHERLRLSAPLGSAPGSDARHRASSA